MGGWVPMGARPGVATLEGVEIRQLECVVAVAGHQHFGRAAASLHMGQPALSQQIKRLERELGVTLFERSSRHVAITAAGEEFVPLAREVLAATERARSFQVPEVPRLRLGIAPGLGLALPEALAALHRRRPDLVVEQVQVPEQRRLAAVRDGVMDAAIVRQQPAASELVRTPLGQERLWALLPEHLVSGRRRRDVDAEQLSGLPALLLADDGEDELVPAVGSRTSSERFSVPGLLAQWASGTDAWTPLHPLHAHLVERMRLPNVVVLPVAPAVTGSLTLVTRRPPGGAVRTLAETVQAALRKAG